MNNYSLQEATRKINKLTKRHKTLFRKVGVSVTLISSDRAFYLLENQSLEDKQRQEQNV